MDEKLLGHFNRIEKHHWWWEGRRQILRQEIDNKSNLKILDIGCGTGETLSFLNNHLSHPDLYGVDSSSVAVEYAKSRGHKQILKVEADMLPFKDDTFDYVLLLDVLEHIKDDSSVLSEAKRVLKRNGKIIMTVPALQFLWSEHDAQQGHYRRYVRRKVKSLAKKTKMTIEKISYFNFFLSPAIVAVRLLSRIKPFSKLGDFDSNLNYDVANKNIVNKILTFIFVNEIRLMKRINYPFGISIFSVMKKN